MRPETLSPPTRGLAEACAAVLAAILFTASLANARTGLRICNKTDETVFYAVGYWEKKSWNSKGWYELKPGACGIPVSKITNTRYYLHAEDASGGTWGTDYTFCVHPRNAFTIEGDERCEERNYATARFFEIKTETDAKLFTQNLVPASPSASSGTGGSPQSSGYFSVGDGVYVSGFLSDKPATIIEFNQARTSVKVRWADDGTVEWISADRLITRSDKAIKDVGRVGIGLGLAYCLFNPSACGESEEE